MAKKPVLKLQKITEGAWLFLDYNDPEMVNIERRIVICKELREDGTWWGVRYLFPLLNEKGITSGIYELQLARKAIRYLKKLEKDIP